MLGPSRLVSLLVAAVTCSVPVSYAAQARSLASLRDRSNAALAAHMQAMKASVLAQKPNGTAPGVQNITFSNPKASGSLSSAVAGSPD
jgi:hypothetical protein